MVHSNGYHICFSSYISITMFQNYQTFAQCLVQKPQFRHTKIITMSLQSLQSYFICQKKTRYDCKHGDVVQYGSNQYIYLPCKCKNSYFSYFGFCLTGRYLRDYFRTTFGNCSCDIFTGRCFSRQSTERRRCT